MLDKLWVWFSWVNIISITCIGKTVYNVQPLNLLYNGYYYKWGCTRFLHYSAIVWFLLKVKINITKSLMFTIYVMICIFLCFICFVNMFIVWVLEHYQYSQIKDGGNKNTPCLSPTYVSRCNFLFHVFRMSVEGALDIFQAAVTKLQNNVSYNKIQICGACIL